LLLFCLPGATLPLLPESLPNQLMLARVLTEMGTLEKGTSECLCQLIKMPSKTGIEAVIIIIPEESIAENSVHF
jgi:hypothetical protein